MHMSHRDTLNPDMWMPSLLLVRQLTVSLSDSRKQKASQLFCYQTALLTQ